MKKYAEILSLKLEKFAQLMRQYQAYLDNPRKTKGLSKKDIAISLYVTRIGLLKEILQDIRHIPEEKTTKIIEALGSLDDRILDIGLNLKFTPIERYFYEEEIAELWGQV